MNSSRASKKFWQLIQDDAKRYFDSYNVQVEATHSPEWLEPRETLVTGSGDSFAAAIAGASLAGYPQAVVDPLSLYKYSSRLGGTLIAVSLGGRTRAVLEAAEAYKKSGGSVIAVTRKRDSPLASISDHIVTVESKEYVRGSGFSTFISMTAAVASLLGMKRRAKNYSPLPREWRIYGKPIYVGTGPFEGLALFLALKHYELFGEQARSYSLEQFLHAPVFAVSQAETVVLLGMQDDYHTNVESILERHGIRVFNAMMKGDAATAFLAQAFEGTLWLASKVREKDLDEPAYRSRKSMAWELARIIYT